MYIDETAEKPISSSPDQVEGSLTINSLFQEGENSFHSQRDSWFSLYKSRKNNYPLQKPKDQPEMWPGALSLFQEVKIYHSINGPLLLQKVKKVLLLPREN